MEAADGEGDLGERNGGAGRVGGEGKRFGLDAVRDGRSWRVAGGSESDEERESVGGSVVDREVGGEDEGARGEDASDPISGWFELDKIQEMESDE